MASEPEDRIISEHWRKTGIERLLTSPRDLALSGARVVTTSAESQGSAQHISLFQSYIGDLSNVIPEARRIWLAIIAKCQQTVGDRNKAMIEALRFQPAGAAFDARVVGVIRKYWLACDAINQQTERERVPPEVFLLEWLLKSGHQDAADVLAGMPYWPIGLDRDGNWV